MKTLRIVLLLTLFVSCNKEDNNCECINKVTETASYYIQGCNPEFIESIKAAEKSDRIWKQFEHDYPCE